ncbi:hypothetical protein PMAYCL1PPCAC_27412, partial [Pristionchus mayeri]
SLPSASKMQALSLCRNQTVEIPPVPSKLYWAAQKAVMSFSSPTSFFTGPIEKYDRLMPLVKATLNAFPYDPKAFPKNSYPSDFLYDLPDPCPDYLLGTDYFFMEHYAHFLESVANLACAVGKDKFSID